jgi:hypothetical protein
MKHLPSFERIRYLQADTATAYVHCLSLDVNIFTKQSKLDMLASGMPVCATQNSESLRQVHTAFTVFCPSCKYAEIKWISKYGYAPGINVIKPVTDEGTSDDRFITGCQFASDPQLPIEEVNSLSLRYILNCDHDITAENRARAGFILIFIVNGTCYRFHYNKSLVAVIVEKSCQLMLTVPTIIKYDDPWLSHDRSFYLYF